MGLTSLDLERCEALQSLPESVGQLTGLTSLDLRYCEVLQSLLKSVGQLTGLTSLDLERCEALQGISRFWWAAAKGDARAQCNLGACYYYGVGVEKDEKRAAVLYAKAAELYAKDVERGDAWWQYFLGECYARDRGGGRDEAIALYWMRKAAEQGDPTIKAKLAEYLMEGLGGTPDWVEAMRLFESSLGTKAPSLIMSAWMLWTGHYGVQQNRGKAIKMSVDVYRMEDSKDQRTRFEVVGRTWPAALKWFESGIGRWGGYEPKMTRGDLH
jgi:TPR repeat protein